jgi:hypothetical protein
MAEHDDWFGKRPKHVARYCKQKGISLSLKFCRMSERLRLMSLTQSSEDEPEGDSACLLA